MQNEPRYVCGRGDRVGEGQYGVVYRARDTKENRIVALKKMRLDSEEEGIPCTAIREISLLKELRHENIVQLLDVMHGDRKLTLVFEFLDVDLQKYMELKGGALDPAVIKHLMKQLLLGIGYCHERMVMHRDLKPQNLLIRMENNDLKIADFGLGRAYEIPVTKMTQDVVTLWYRPPDVLLGSTKYSTSIDMWSIGCIFVEMATGRPLFNGRDDADQLTKIFKVLGKPSAQEWPSVDEYPNTANMLASDAFRQEFPRRAESFAQEHALLEKLGPEGVDLMLNLLHFEPSRRLSATDALAHPYFK